MIHLNQVRGPGLLPDDCRVIHLFEGGSALHGGRLGENSDLDICGIFLEPAIKIFGLDSFEHFVTSTADATRRNHAGDVDITMYSLRRWAQLATKGNPTAINYLFAPNVAHSDDLNDTWMRNRANLRRAVIAKSAAGHYVGFVDGQMKRLLGQGTGKHGQREELTHKFGYDTKAAMHAVRLMHEGIELMETGRVTFPRPERLTLIDIRIGGWSLDRVCAEVSELRTKLETARDKSDLQAKPDRQSVNRVLANVYRRHYVETF